MQASVKNTDVLASLLTDHSPITFSHFKNQESNRSKGILQYNIRKYTTKFSKKLAKNTNKKIADLETKLKHFEKHYENYVDNIDYKFCKQQLDAIYKQN